MENLDKLYDLTEKIKSIIYTVEFKQNDVRKAYFENLYSIINQFYIGNIFFKIAQEIKTKTVKFDPSLFTFQRHIGRIYETAEHQILSDAYLNELNRKLFADTFTNFETTISLCFDDIITDVELDLIIKDLNSKILKICQNLQEAEIQQLLNELKKNAFIPLSRKFRYLSKLKENGYPSDAKADIAFIEFCSKLRNCVSHSAAYYKGKDFVYEFEKIKFIFKNGAFLEMVGKNDFIFLKINERLTIIINDLFKCLKHIDFIQYPDDGF